MLDDDDELAAMLIKARLGGGVDEHIGECAVIAYAQRRGLLAVLDDRAAIEQADRLGVQSVGTMWIIVEAYKSLWDRSANAMVAAIDALLDTDMRLCHCATAKKSSRGPIGKGYFPEFPGLRRSPDCRALKCSPSSRGVEAPTSARLVTDLVTNFLETGEKHATQ